MRKLLLLLIVLMLPVRAAKSQIADSTVATPDSVALAYQTELEALIAELQNQLEKQGPTTTQKFPIDKLSLSYGESPIASGLTLSVEAGNFVGTIAEQNAEFILFLILEKHLACGPSGGVMAQVPWLGVYCRSSALDCYVDVWTGSGAGTFEGGFDISKSQANFFAYGAAGCKRGIVDASLSFLSVEGGRFSGLAALSLAPPIRRALSGILAITYDLTTSEYPMLLAGVAIDLRPR